MADRLSPSELDKFHEFRKRFPYLYICKKCTRAFDAQRPEDKCKFCGGEVKEIEKDDRVSAKPMYTYVCPMCYKEFVAEHADKCVKCGGRFLHKYKTVRVGTRQLLSMRKNQIKEGTKRTISKVKNKASGKTENRR